MNKEVIWTKGHKLEAVDLVNESGDSFDLKYQVSFIKYWEDVIDPALHVDVTLNDTHSLINKIPIRSGNLVRIQLKHPSQEGILELELIVTNISNHFVNQKRESYTLTCETKGALSNHTNRVWTKFKGSIAASVSKIINEKLSSLNKNEEMIDPSLLKEGEEREIDGKLYVWNGDNFIPKTT